MAADRVVSALAQQERLAEEVMDERHQIVQLDARRNDNRVALGQLRRHGLANASKVWLNVGEMFIQLPRGEVERIIEADQVELTTAIDAARQSSQKKAQQLQEREGKPMSAGWGLKSMSRHEFSGPAV